MGWWLLHTHIFRLISLFEDHVFYNKGTGTAFKIALVKQFNDASFPNFANLILEMVRENKYGYGYCSISTMGGHIMPYHKCCALCDVDYDVIGLVEDFDNDFNYITQKGNLTKILNNVNVVENRADRSMVSQSKWKIKRKTQVMQRMQLMPSLLLLLFVICLNFLKFLTLTGRKDTLLLLNAVKGCYKKTIRHL